MNTEIIEVVDQEAAYLQHIIQSYSLLFEKKYKLGNGKYNYVGRDLKKELTAVMNRLNSAIEQQ